MFVFIKQLKKIIKQKSRISQEKKIKKQKYQASLEIDGRQAHVLSTCIAKVSLCPFCGGRLLFRKLGVQGIPGHPHDYYCMACEKVIPFYLLPMWVSSDVKRQLCLQARSKIREVLGEALLDTPERVREMYWFVYDLAEKGGVYYHSKKKYYEYGLDGQRFQDLGELIKYMDGQPGMLPFKITDSLAAAHLNRGVSYVNQGRYEEAEAEYAYALELREALFTAGLLSVVPGLAMAFYNLLLLLRKEKSGEAGETASKASAFLENLAGMTDINALPESWRRELDDLEKLIKKTGQ